MRKRSWLNILVLIVGLVIGILGVVGVCQNFMSHSFGIGGIIPMIVAFCGLMLAGIACIYKR